jgi:hypothetical protein
LQANTSRIRIQKSKEDSEDKNKATVHGCLVFILFDRFIKLKRIKASFKMIEYIAFGRLGQLLHLALILKLKGKNLV